MLVITEADTILVHICIQETVGMIGNIIMSTFKYSQRDLFCTVKGSRRAESTSNRFNVVISRLQLIIATTWNSFKRLR